MVKLRPQKITLESPSRNEDMWIRVNVQKIIEDDNGNIISIVPRNDYIHRKPDEFANTLFDFEDPVLDKKIQLSGTGVRVAFFTAVLTWMKDKYGGEIMDGEICL